MAVADALTEFYPQTGALREGAATPPLLSRRAVVLRVMLVNSTISECVLSLKLIIIQSIRLVLFCQGVRGSFRIF
ncbi:hypothetical protein SE15_02485 [Thermanaerothrix daxensis]|uniref:Uncharacterized protein n=1 Tax=Thermanaerothrix daxensis TaxID=869279 RepID=A0A0P6Y3T1_9CHLR|nr:hypothetical protein SE15_02485 [Thermanaerothrix daxensis]